LAKAIGPKSCGPLALPRDHPPGHPTASAEAVQAIIDGKGMQAAAAQHFSEMGHTAVMTLADALEGKSVEPIIDTGTTVVTKSNASDFLKTIQ
jgi:ABC-type sugar transport system substrate-binding protein